MIDEHLEEGELIGFIAHALRVPLDADEEGIARILDAFDDAVGGFGDDAEAAAEGFDGLFVAGLYVHIGVAYAVENLRAGFKLNGVAAVPVAHAAVFDLSIAGEIGDELDEASAAMDVHQLAAETDAEGGEAAAFDFGDEGAFEFFAEGVDGFDFGEGCFAVAVGVQVRPTAEEDAVEGSDKFRNQGEIGAIGEHYREAAGPFHAGGVAVGQRVLREAIVVIHGNSDEGSGHNLHFCSRSPACTSGTHSQLNGGSRRLRAMLTMRP